MKIPLPPAAPEILASLALPFGVAADSENTIEILLESPWADVADIENFIEEFYPAPSYCECRVQRLASLGISRLVSAYFDLRSRSALRVEHNAPGYGALYLIDDILRGKQSIVYRDGEIDRVATDAAADARSAIAEDWRTWLWSDAGRCQKYLDRYWKYFQCLTPAPTAKIDATGCAISLRPLQIEAAGRLIAQNTFVSADVGAGKTAAMVTALRQGSIKKAIVLTQAGLVHSTLTEFRKAYPDFQGIVLAPSTVGDRSSIKRAVVAFGRREKGVIIMSHQTFRDVIDHHPSAEIEALEEDREIALSALRDHDQFVAENRYLSIPPWRLLSNLRSQVQGIEDRLNKLRNKSAPSRCLTRLGVDLVLCDEADCYKNQAVRCRRSIHGIPTSGSALSSHMLLCSRELRQMGSVLGFLSGSWPDNSLIELWTAALYHDREGLKTLGLQTFDAWLGLFTVVSQARETDVSGKSVVRWRVQQFINFQLLLALKRFVCWGTTPLTEDRPEIHRIIVPCDSTELQKQFLDSLSSQE